ncbi:hypothetical protein EYF80_046660 [Liparis tanakae]|uniref:Uncharacterized protein n=1 Tax=Liparis tanakae TaxID=230148 RepID=A0A4Z2FPK1_9TELE|nr:hypothetical protein EYF80_046660 [Liparis tanakae]
MKAALEFDPEQLNSTQPAGFTSECIAAKQLPHIPPSRLPSMIHSSLHRHSHESHFAQIDTHVEKERLDEGRRGKDVSLEVTTSKKKQKQIKAFDTGFHSSPLMPNRHIPLVSTRMSSWFLITSTKKVKQETQTLFEE